MITLKTKEEIAILREGGKILAEALEIVAMSAKPGISTFELNKIAEDFIAKFGAKPSFKDYRPEKGMPPYPAALCTSLNDEIVHCVPKKERILKDGDILGLDLGVWHKNLCTDAAITIAIGAVPEKAKKLIDTTEKSLYSGIDEAVVGNAIGDIGYAVSEIVKAGGFAVIRDLVGHGVGHAVHEDPQIPNYGQKGKGDKLKEGMVLAIEPMTAAGDWRMRPCEDDRFGYCTFDGGLSAHFEHTIVVTVNGPEILTRI